MTFILFDYIFKLSLIIIFLTLLVLHDILRREKIKKLKKLSGLFLALAMVLSLNLTVFAAEPESIERQTYQVEVDGEVYTVTDDAVIEIPMESLAPSTRASSDTVVGDVGTLTVRGSGHYVYWTIVMTKPATSFSGTVSSTDITSGLSSGTATISGFSGKVYAARISGHTYTATLSGVAYNGIIPVAKTGSNRVTWKA